MPDIIGTLMGLLGGGNGLLAGLAGILGVIVAAFFKGRSSGKAAERAKTDRDRLDSMTEAQRIDEAIAGRDPAANRKELGRWSPWGKQ